MNRALNFCVATAAITLSLLAQAHDPAALYLGNEGILVRDGNTKILFDAFYRDSYDEYVLVDEATSDALIAGEPPFDGIDAVFISHAHGDHFTAGPTIAYLRAQPEVMLYGSAQVRHLIAAALKQDDDPLLKRVIAFGSRPGGEPVRIKQGQLTIGVVSIPHAGGAPQAGISNLVFRVALDGQPTILHLGDADPDDQYFAPLQSYWDETPLAAAFPPSWFYSQGDGPLILKQRLKADQTIGIHVPAAAIGHGDAWRARVGGDLFTDPGEQRILQSDAASQ